MENVASSSGSNLKEFLTGMGFLPSLVEKVIEENGENNVDLLLEILIKHTELETSGLQSSESSDSLFDDMESSIPSEVPSALKTKEEVDEFDTVDHGRRDSLLKMNFTVNEVEFAMDKLGDKASIDEIVDFIIAAQMADNLDKQAAQVASCDEQKIMENNKAMLYGTMDKTLCLLKMGFSENEVSWAIEKFGSHVPIYVLADSICEHQAGRCYVKTEKCCADDDAAACDSAPVPKPKWEPVTDCLLDSIKVETDSARQALLPATAPAPAAACQSRRISVVGAQAEKRPKLEPGEEHHPDYGSAGIGAVAENGPRAQLKQPKREHVEESRSHLEYPWTKAKPKADPESKPTEIPSTVKPPPGAAASSGKRLDEMAAKAPYFLYGNVGELPSDAWAKISRFLFAIEPEFVDSGRFSALSRKEGYVHNLPTDDRSHVLPRSPVTLEEALPDAGQWWPSWDTRKQLTFIGAETSGIGEVCDALGRMLGDSRRGSLSSEQKADIRRQCQSLNLVWVGPYQLAPIQPEHLELILGYPRSHTQGDDMSATERVDTMRHCFQTDTLGYHLSVLKSIFLGPAGGGSRLTVLSLFSGIGGAEVALTRLGIHLKAVVAVETSEAKRKILARWWRTSGQSGALEMVHDIQKLTTNKLEKFMEKFGRFDFIICQNSASYTPKSSKNGADGVASSCWFHSSVFYEFVRVLQCVRGLTERKSQAVAVGAS